MQNFQWQQITFIDGSNPYICKTPKEFSRMKEKYLLENVSANNWCATDRIYYCVVGFDDINKRATFYKSNLSKTTAYHAINKLMDMEHMKEIILRKEISYLLNNDRLEISSSSPIEQYARNNGKWNIIFAE